MNEGGDNCRRTDIDYFFAFFEHRLSFVEQTCLHRIEGVVLMCAYIDSLAKYRFGKSGSRDRFRKFLIAHGDSRGYWQRLSLWLIAKDLRQGILPAPEGFSKVLDRQFGSVYNFYQLGFNPDMSIEELEKQAEGYTALPWDVAFKASVEKYDYASILWRKYRNPAIHESVIDPEAAPEGLSENESVPFYRHINMMNAKEHKIGFEDVWFRIPARFILSSLKESLADFKQYAIANSLVF